MTAAVRDTLIVLALVAGPPVGLLAVAGSPIPDRLPSAAVLADWVHDPLQPAFGAVLAVTAGWLLCAAYTGAILACVADQARLRRMYACLPGPVRGLTATVLGAAADAIIRHDERYRLNLDMIETDLHQLRRAIAAAATAVTGHQRQTAAQAIIDAYHGELAAGFSWPWLHPIREALRRDVIDAHLQLAAAAPPAEALDLVGAAIAADPYNEALHEEAQGILTAIGEHDAAQALRHGVDQRLLAAGLRPPKATTDSPPQPGAAVALTCTCDTACGVVRDCAPPGSRLSARPDPALPQCHPKNPLGRTIVHCWRPRS